MALQIEATTYEDAKKILHLGKRKEAIAHLILILESNPNHHDARCLLGQAYSWGKKYKKAEAEYKKVLAAKPAYRDALIGMARLRGYQGRFEEALALSTTALEKYPNDNEIKTVKEKFQKFLRGEKCGFTPRFTARGGFEHENYSFTTNGAGLGISLQDRNFHGWNAAVATHLLHRFDEEDIELAAEGARSLGWKKLYGVFSGGAAPRHILYPKYRLTAGGGLPLIKGVSFETHLGYKVYNDAKVTEILPRLFTEWRGFTFNFFTTLSYSRFRGGTNSGGLSSYHTKLGWNRSCLIKPWISYAHTKEAFEAGRAGGLGTFRADHVGIGANIQISRKVGVGVFYSREDRPDDHQHITRTGVNVSYSWDE